MWEHSSKNKSLFFCLFVLTLKSEEEKEDEQLTISQSVQVDQVEPNHSLRLRLTEVKNAEWLKVVKAVTLRAQYYQDCSF